MLKNKITLEHISGGKVFHFTCDVDSSVDQVREAFGVFMQYADHVEKQAKILQEKAAQEQAENSQAQPESDIKPE